jgi:hypothetical protein
LLQSLRGMLSDDVFVRGYVIADQVEQLAHESSCPGPFELHRIPRCDHTRRSPDKGGAAATVQASPARSSADAPNARENAMRARAATRPKPIGGNETFWISRVVSS